MLSLVGNQRYAGMLRASMQQLLHLALGYMQMTAAQVGALPQQQQCRCCCCCTSSWGTCS